MRELTPQAFAEKCAGTALSERASYQQHFLDELRRNWLNPGGVSEAELKKCTMTNVYNAHPMWLANAHDRFGAAVFAAYGWPEGITDEEILKNLLALNLERSEGESG